MRLLVSVPIVVMLALSPRSTPSAAAGHHGDDPAIARAVDRYVAPWLARGELSGELLMLRGDDVVLDRCWGMADVALGVPVTPATRFAIASVTKPMTTVLAIELIVEGRLALGDPLSKWLPDFPHGDSITVPARRHRPPALRQT